MADCTSARRKKCVLLPIAAFASISLDANDVVIPFAAAIRNRSGILFAPPFDRDVRPSANLVFHSHAHAAVRRVFERRRRYAGRPVFVLPQYIDPRHQWNSKLGPLFAHTLSIGKKLKKPNLFLCVLCVESFLNVTRRPQAEPEEFYEGQRLVVYSRLLSKSRSNIQGSKI